MHKQRSQEQINILKVISQSKFNGLTELPGFRELFEKYTQKTWDGTYLSQSFMDYKNSLLQFLFALWIFDINNKRKPLKNLEETNLFQYIQSIVNRNDPDAMLQANVDAETKKLINHLFILPNDTYTGDYDELGNKKVLPYKKISINGKELVYTLDSAIVLKDSRAFEKFGTYTADVSIGMIKPCVTGEYKYGLLEDGRTDADFIWMAHDLQEFFPDFSVLKPVLLVYKITNPL